jgi:hypothetical protein
MSIICSDTRMPYVAPEVFEFELQEMVERREDELWLSHYHLQVARNVAQQLRDLKSQ